MAVHELRDILPDDLFDAVCELHRLEDDLEGRPRRRRRAWLGLEGREIAMGPDDPVLQAL